MMAFMTIVHEEDNSGEALVAARERLAGHPWGKMHISRYLINRLKEVRSGRDSWLAVTFGGTEFNRDYSERYVLHIQSSWLNLHLRAARLVYDFSGEENVTVKMLTVNARVGKTRSGDFCLASATKADAQRGWLGIIEVAYDEPDLSSQHKVHELARDGDEADATSFRLVFVKPGGLIRASGRDLTYMQLVYAESFPSFTDEEAYTRLTKA
jgi:hypothetical protein